MVGLHFQETYAGKVFSQTTTPLGLALPIYNTVTICTAGICGLPIWNPPGSGVIAELIEVTFGYASGTADFGAIVLMAGYVNSIATASGMSAIVPTTPTNGYLGQTANSKVVSSNGAGTCTVTAGLATPPVSGVAGAGMIRTLADFNLEAQSGTAHSTGGRTYVFNGTLIVSPGVLVYLASTKASVALYSTSIVWKEIQVTR